MILNRINIVALVTFVLFVAGYFPAWQILVDKDEKNQVDYLAKIEELKPSFPPGVELVVTYDRSELIKHAIDTLKHQLMEEMIIVSLVILLFLWHFPSAVIPIVTIPA